MMSYQPEQPNLSYDADELILPPEIIPCRGVGPLERYIYGYIYGKQCHGELVTASNTELVDYLVVSRRAILQSLKILESAGLLQRVSHYDDSGRYQRTLTALEPWRANPDWTFTVEQRRAVGITQDEHDEPVTPVEENVAPVIYIYALIDPRTEQVRYIGQTHSPRQRLSKHKTAPTSSEMAEWLGDLKQAGIRPRLAILEPSTITTCSEAERKWISHYREAGAPLLNRRDGGFSLRR